jgi:MtaA/CmuA family methyltransferase
VPVLGIGQRVVSDSSSSNLRRNCRLHRRGTTPLAVAHFEPSQETKDRVADLIHREKTTSLGPDETSELDYCLRVGRRYRRPYGLRSPVVMSLPGRYTAFTSGVLRAVLLTTDHSTFNPQLNEVFAMNGRERVLKFLDGKAVDRLPLMPVVMMFCADQIGVKYGRYVEDFRVLAEAQIRTAEMFDFDIVSCLSDPAREAADCGAHVEFFEDQPAAIIESDALLADKSALATLATPPPLGGGRMHAAVQGLELMKEEVGREKAVMGWVEGPCAEAADLRGINTLMLDFFDDPSFVRDLFDFVLEMELRYAQAQVDVGVEIIGIGDAAASLVGPQIYAEFIWPYEKKLVDGLHEMGVHTRLHICGNTNSLLDGMGRLGCAIVDLDFMVPLADARAAMGPEQILLGNIDPVKQLRNATSDEVTAAIAECHRQAGDRYIIGAGCEIPRDTPLENVRALTEYARSTAR